jgi:hypothetical protein
LEEYNIVPKNEGDSDVSLVLGMPLLRSAISKAEVIADST